MSTWTAELAIIRRFLRDPNALIWESDALKILWNAAAIEVAQKIGLLERARAYSYPPVYTWSFVHDWEKGQIEGDRYQPFTYYQQSGLSICHPWEGFTNFTTVEPSDDGYRMTQAWESGYEDPGDPIRIPLHVRHESMRYVAFNEETLTGEQEKTIALQDGAYRTTEGTPYNYYHPDEEHNEVVLYPRPSSIDWDDSVYQLHDSQGIVTWEDDAYTESETGIILDDVTISTKNTLFIVFKCLPGEVDDAEDEIPDWPDYMTKMVRQATLERAFGMNTDGFIPTLRDYWKGRKDASIKAIKFFLQDRKRDRDYRLGEGRPKERHNTLRLPSTYPAI